MPKIIYYTSAYQFTDWRLPTTEYYILQSIVDILLCCMGFINKILNEFK